MTSAQTFWLQFPTVHAGLKQAAEPLKPPMMVEPYRATAAGPTGWQSGYGYRDAGNVHNALQQNPALKKDLQPQLQELGTQAAAKSWLPYAAGTAAYAAGSQVLPKLLGMYPPTRALAAIAGPAATGLRASVGRFVAGQNGLGKLVGPAALASGAVAAVPANKLTQSLADRLYAKNPDTFNDQAKLPVSQAVADRYRVHDNPLQTMLQSLQNNPEARNAIIGLLLGGLGGSVAGGIGGHPIIGALLGALGGGAFGGMNPQLGHKSWNNFYNSAWQQAGQLNNRPLAAPVKPAVPAPV